MKVSAVLVGVNVAATLGIAMQQQACAEEGTAAFLKSSLSGVKGSASQPVGLSAQPAKSMSAKALPSKRASKVSLSDPRSVATRKALDNSVGGVKLRPFMAGRKLPSKYDRDDSYSGELQTQVAALDYSNQPTTLNGGVSQFTPYYVSSDVSARGQYELKQAQKRADSRRLRNAAKVASTFQHQTAPKMVPGAPASLPGQVGHPCAEFNMQGGFDRLMPADPRGTLIFGAQNPLVQQHQFGQQNMAPNQFAQQNFAPPAMTHAPAQQLDMHPAQVPVEAPLAAPHLTPQEQFEMNKLVEAACLQNGINPNVSQFAQQQGAEGLYSRVGAPPFPLSLIPESAMQNFLKGARGKRSVLATSPVGGGMPAPNLAHASTTGSGIGAGLPKAGFRSYAREAMNVNAFRSYQRMPTSMPVKPHHAAPQPKKMSVSSMPAQVEPQRERPMTYPPYKSNVNFGS